MKSHIFHLILFAICILLFVACAPKELLWSPDNESHSPADVSLLNSEGIHPSANTSAAQESATSNVSEYTELDNGNIISLDGTEYPLLAWDAAVRTFGSNTFLGKVKGEAPSFNHMGLEMETGIYSCEGDADLRVLKRQVPENEWSAYYRKASLPTLDLSPDNCIRFELIGYKNFRALDLYDPDIRHISCNAGIAGQEEIRDFLSDIRAQQTAQEAGLYNLVTTADGWFENLYEGLGCGYFEGEPNLAIPFHILSFNDKAYSIRFGDDEDSIEYVLPEKWFLALQETMH